MNLKEIREMLIKLSGRYDFKSTPNTADFFIRGGCTDLDLEQETGEEFNYYEESLAVGECKTKMQHCRSIQGVWFEDSDDVIVPLTYKQYDELVSLYNELEATDSGTPAYWSKNLIQRDPANYLAGDLTEYTGVIIMPPTDEVITLRVYGVFHSVPLLSDEDENYWSNRYPNLLVMAALRNIEGFYRNTQGYNDYDAIIQRKLRGIDKDLAEQSTAHEMRMKG